MWPVVSVNGGGIMMRFKVRRRRWKGESSYLDVKLILCILAGATTDSAPSTFLAPNKRQYWRRLENIDKAVCPPTERGSPLYCWPGPEELWVRLGLKAANANTSRRQMAERSTANLQVRVVKYEVPTDYIHDGFLAVA